MQRDFHIFRQLSDGAPLWVEAAFDLKQARRRLSELEPASYAIFDVSNGCFVVPFGRAVSAIARQPQFD